MKLLACSDLHRDMSATQRIVDASADANVVVVAGDVATKRIGAVEVLQQLDRCQAPVLVVHGNHDDAAGLSDFCSSSQRLQYLHGNSVALASSAQYAAWH